MGTITRSFANLITASGPSDVASGSVTAADLSGNINFRNIVINGDMSIAQRSTSVASITTNGYYTADRCFLGLTGAGTWTQSQSTDVPTGEGFATSLKMDNTTANGSLSAGDSCIIQQRIEGQNLQYIKKGTASAISLTVSFWIKATKTGTNICELYDTDNTRQISASYTVNTTNTWEKKTVTFAGDTTGTLGNDNGGSLTLLFWLAAGTNFTSGTLNTSWNSATNANRAVGQVNNADSTSNDWYITGVQLEAGTTASDFEFLPVDVNLRRCFRYFQDYSQSVELRFIAQQATYADANGLWIPTWKFPNGDMRAIPTLTYTDVASPANSLKMTVRKNGGTETNNINLRPFTNRLKNNRVDFNTYNETTGLDANGNVGFAFAKDFKLDAEL
jgi:hypothetical protein